MPDSQRNALIDDFNHGVVHPDYEVIPNKTTKGKFTVRKRKVSLPVRKEGDPPPKEGDPPPKEEEEPRDEIITDSTYNPFADEELYIPQGSMKQGAMFREMQMTLNRMILEQMKMIRQGQKYQMKKHDKYKEKTKKVYDIISSVANQSKKPEPQQEEEEETQEQFDQRQQEQYQEYDEPQDEPQYQEERPPQQEYQNEYEEQLDTLTGDNQPTYSRRNRLRSFI